MSFRERWIKSIHTIATGSRKSRNLLTPVGFVMFYGILTLLILLSLGVDKLAGLPRMLGVSRTPALFLPIVFIGLFFLIWSVISFARVKGTPVPFNPPPKLVTSGPYAFVRNPMLTGVFILMFGIGLWLGSISLCFIITPLFIILVYFEIKKVEEPELELRLGQDYIEYKKRVPMFFPRLKK